MKKIVALISVFILFLTGCGASDNNSDAKIGFVTDTGGINDKSFNQGTWEGIKEFAEENNMSASYTETADQALLEQNLKAAADQNDVVVAAGFNHANPLYEVATADSETKFILIDSIPQQAGAEEPATLENVQSYIFKEEEAGYLVGYIAGLETKTNIVGFIGGMKVPAVERFGYGYIQGVAAANPNAKILYNYTGDFSNVSLGKTTANTMYSQGADIIFSAAGGVNAGVVQSAIEHVQKDEEVWVIGVDKDMYEDGIYEDGKSIILTSAVKKVDEAAKAGLTLFKEGKINGEVETLGFSDDAVGLPAENPNLTPEIEKEAKTALENVEQIYTSAEEINQNINIEISGEI